MKQSTLDVGVPLRKSWKLNPSDFAFLWDECPRCFYLKLVHDFGRPIQPFPRIFGQIDAQMKVGFEGKRLDSFFPNAPKGTFHNFGGKVESRPIELPGCSSTCFLQGSYDALVKVDGSGYCVIDFKTTAGGDKIAFRYARQLHAYAWALERAVPRAEHAAPVTQLGLILFKPEAFEAIGDAADYKGRLQWVPVQRDDATFEQMLKKMVDLLDAPEAPAPDPGCMWCEYRRRVRKIPF